MRRLHHLAWNDPRGRIARAFAKQCSLTRGLPTRFTIDSIANRTKLPVDACRRAVSPAGIKVMQDIASVATGYRVRIYKDQEYVVVRSLR